MFQVTLFLLSERSVNICGRAPAGPDAGSFQGPVVGNVQGGFGILVPFSWVKKFREVQASRRIPHHRLQL
jgi:hypothetical protein